MVHRRAWIAAAFGITVAACTSTGTTAPRSAVLADPTATIQVFSQKDPRLDGLLRQQISEFTRAHPTITVNVTHYGTEELRERFQTEAVAHSGPDIVYGPNDNLGPWATLKIVQPLDQVLGDRFFAPFQPVAVAASRYRGHVYALPDVYGNHLMLLYDRRLLATAPVTTDQLLSVARELTDPAAGRFGLVFDQSEPYWLMPWIGGFGGQVFDSRTRPTLDTAATVEALRFERSMMASGAASSTVGYDEADALFKSGQAAMIVNGDWSLAAYRDALGPELGIAPLPRIPATGRWAAPYTATRGYSINAAVAGDRLAAVKIFLGWIAQTSQNARIARYAEIPAVAAAAAPALAGDPVLAASAAALAHGTPQPIVPQMRAIYDAITTPLAGVLSGKLAPEVAARQMQDGAVRAIQRQP
jgi:arabinogalactan oligomer / maltooligosaccharide transport system substrate-binding protein